MGLPLLPPLPGSSPEWKQNISPSLDFGGLGDTVAAISTGIDTVKSTITSAGTVRQTVLGKAQSWYSTSKAAAGSVNNVLTGFNGNVGDLVKQTTGVLSKGGVLEQVGGIFTELFATATTSTTQLMAVISGSSSIDNATKALIGGHITDLLGGLNNVKNTLLSSLNPLGAQPDFLNVAQTHINAALADLTTKVNTFTGGLVDIHMDANQLPTEAQALGGLVGVGTALLQNPAGVMKSVGDYVSSIKFKMISMSPMVGNFDTLRQGLVNTLNGSFPNTPEDKGVYGAMVLFTRADGMVPAMTTWAEKAVLLFGNHKEMGELISHTLSNPLLSPLGKLVPGTPLDGQINNVNIGKDLPVPAMLQKFGTETMDEIKGAMDTGFLKDLLSTDSPVAKFFSKPSTPTTTARKDALDSKKISLLPTTVNEPPVNTIGIKSITDDLTGLTKDIGSLGKNPENKWLNLKGPEDLFAASGQQIDIVSKIIKDISGIVPKLQSSIQTLLTAVQHEADSLANIKLPSLDEAKTELNKIPGNIGNINFDVLLLPPIDGGLKTLRMKLTDWVKPSATNAPLLVDNTALFAIIIVMSAPSLSIGSTQMGALVKQFQHN